MNITFQSVNPAYRSPAPAMRKRTPQSGNAKGDYDTVNIRRPQAAPDDDETFARMLARKTSAQISGGADPERVKELGRRIADGTYQPDPQRIAGRLLGLG